MPTENRSSNTEQMVSVPRDEVERLVKLLQYQAHPYPSPHAEFWQGLLDAQAVQHQGLVTGDLACVYDVIGLHHSHPVSVLIANFENIKRFSDYLDAIEREFFMVPGKPSDEPEDAGCEPADRCLVSKFPAHSIEHYVEQFREALASKFTPPTSDGFSAGDMADQGAKAFRDGQRALALPERRQWNGLGNAADNLKASGWNACLDEVRRLNEASISLE